MKKMGFLGMIAVVLLSVSFAYAGPTSYYIAEYVGTVKVSTDSGKTWKNAAVDMELKESDMIKTGANSSCAITMPKQGNFVVVANSEIVISKLNQKDSLMKVASGKLLVNFESKLKKNESFKIETKVATAAVRGTEYIIDFDSKAIRCEVASGVVTMTRNINIPEGVVLDDEMKKLLQVDITKNKALEMTLDENKHLEDLLVRVKGNKAEYKKILKENNSATKRKIKLQQNARRLFDLMHGAEESEGNSDPEMDEYMDKLNKKKNR